MLCYVPAIDSYTAFDHAEDLQAFNEHVVQEEGVDRGAVASAIPWVPGRIHRKHSSPGITHQYSD